jgi:outer membrane protein assembly factor BamB
MPGLRLALPLVLLCATAHPQDWPSFRGPFASGVADGQDLPAEWDVASSRNVRWKQALPGVGHSSPIVWGDRIYVTTAVAAEAPKLVLGDEGDTEPVDDRGPVSWRLLCLDAKTGEILWDRKAYQGAPRAKRHVKASQANATPATDGKTVVALYGSEGLAAFDREGKPIWRVDLGVLDPGLLDDPKSQWGHASSPVIFEDLAIVQVDRHSGSFLAAYDLATGRPAWKVARAERPVWATPTLHVVDGKPELVVVGGVHVRGYDPRTGQERWRFKDVAEVKTPTPFVSHGLVIFAGGYRGRPLFAIREGARGDVSVTDDARKGPFLAWRSEPGGPYTTTPVAYGDLLYMVRDEGILGVYEVETGALVYRERTGATHSASPVASDGKIYVPTEEGQIMVLRAGRRFDVIARNEMGETVFATPAIANGTMFVRTHGHLYAIGTPRKEAQRAEAP